MAMINCPECGRKISTRAEICLGCGISQKVIQELLAEQSVKEIPEETISKSPIVDQDKKEAGSKIKCCICKKEYDYSESSDCPTCRYPAFSLHRNKNQFKQSVREYRKKEGYLPLELKAGQYYQMGNYHGEEISWIVLAVEGEKALLLSEKGLDVKPFHNTFAEVNWGISSIRKWLNTDFIEEAFSKEEEDMIEISSVLADRNPFYKGTEPGENTEDKVFLLSFQEVERYFPDEQARKIKPTEFAISNGAAIDTQSKCSRWWLRSPGNGSVFTAFVGESGKIGHGTTYVMNACNPFTCVRPAMWIDTSENRKKNQEQEVSFEEAF